MTEWKEYKIGDLCNTISETYKRNDDEVILINTSDVLDGKLLNHTTVPNENLKGQFKKTFLKDDILYSEIRPANKRFAYVDVEDTSLYIASTKLMVLRPNNAIIEPQFLFAILSSQKMIDELQVRAESRSGTFPQITFGAELAPIKVMVPNKDIQLRIVSFLEAFRGKLDTNEAINRNLEEQANSIFLSEFTDVNELPEGWKEGSLLDIADYLNGLAMQKFRPGQDEIGLPVLKIKDLRQGSCDESNEYCSPNIKPEYIVKDGDVIFSWSGSLLVDIWCGGECGLNQHLFKVTSKIYDKWFYYSWTHYHLDRFIAIAADKATTMGHIKRGELSNAEVLIPSKDDYERLGGVLKPMYDTIINNRIENRKLSSIRDEILPKLMSGDIDISELEI